MSDFSPERLRDRLRSGAAGRLLLKTLSAAYVGVMAARKALYDLGVLKRRRLPVPVVCFGNISAGGTGKTSTVVATALELARAGRRPAVLLRGYKRRKTSGVTVLAKGRTASLEEAGDEALMLYRMLEPAGIPVLVSTDRFASGTIAAAELGADIILMDDGFQHFAIERDADIVLVNATSPFLTDGPLPGGNLREPASALSRASAVVITHCEQAQQDEIDALHSEIRRIAPRAAVIESMHAPETFINPATAEQIDLNALKGRQAVALSGIGDPASFEGALKKMKVDLKQIWRYPDHHVFTPKELAAAQQARAGLPLITTYKDFARFPAGWQETLEGGVLIFSVKIVFLCNGWKTLMNLVDGAGRKGT